MTLDVECLFHQRVIDLVEQKKFILQTKVAEKIIQMMFFLRKYITSIQGI